MRFVYLIFCVFWLINAVASLSNYRSPGADESHRHTVTLPKRTEPEASLREASWFSVALSERPVSVRLRSSRGRPLRGRPRVDLRRPDSARSFQSSTKSGFYNECDASHPVMDYKDSIYKPRNWLKLSPSGQNTARK